MTTLGLLLEKPLEADYPRLASIGEQLSDESLGRVDSIRDEQIQALVQQLFPQPQPAGVRHVGFAPVGPETNTAQLCLDVATVLSQIGSHDVGLIDATLRSVPLPTQLGMPAARGSETEWQISPRLWMVPRRTWVDDSGQGIWDPSLTRLRQATMEYDYSVLCFDPISWVTARISQICDGVVMVLTANKTRRLVAAQMQEQLQRARVPVLGTVLAERRFPVPEGLYRNL